MGYSNMLDEKGGHLCLIFRIHLTVELVAKKGKSLLYICV